MQKSSGELFETDGNPSGQFGERQPGNQKLFLAAGLTRNQLDLRSSEIQRFRQDLDQGIVRFPLFGGLRDGDPQPRFTLPHDGIPSGTRLGLHGENHSLLGHLQADHAKTSSTT